MNSSLVNMILSMVSDDQIDSMLAGISKGLIEYKNSFELLDGEHETMIVMFDASGVLNASIVATDTDNKIIRQIETHLVSDLVKKLLKQSK